MLVEPMRNPRKTSADPLAAFHPLVAAWFRETLGEPSAPQLAGWPAIQARRDVLIAAPTGSGKTLAAFLACLDRLLRQALEGTLPDETEVLYVSPLKALGNDVQKNLLEPLQQIFERAHAEGLDPQPIRVQVRSGDTPASERQRMIRRPPHVLITTPESAYLYLTAERSRETLRPLRTLVVDEIHALARDKRGSHFALSLARLDALCERRPQRIGLSATQKPLDELASFLVGGAPHKNGWRPHACDVVEIGHRRAWELAIETPEDELTAVATHEMWGQVYDRLVQLSHAHRTVLVFTNTRRLAERVAHDLGERLGKAQVSAHHGSMAKELRLKAEARLKAGELKVMVATASLELGLDIGGIDLVCQLGSPRSIATFLQRVGRAGHQKGGLSKGALFAMTRDELVECAALVDAIHRGELDAVRMPRKPLDVLAQQIVAACGAEAWKEDDLFALVRRASPYRDLTRAEFEGVVTMLSEGVATGRGRSRVHLHRDRVNGMLHARRGARLTALTNGGAIPDVFSYPVIALPEEKAVGSVDEDFATESMAGDVFALGSTSWRIRRVAAGKMFVEDAAGQAPTIPFWIAEAPARTRELSEAVARLREEALRRPDARRWLADELGMKPQSAALVVRYLATAEKLLGGIPSSTYVVAERFFDDAGGMQLVIHAPFGGRINRAWGLALRKRFCRSFDFELQAAATDDGILLSLSEQHSFPLLDIFDFVTPRNVEEVLTQAVLQLPLFGTRFRWNATRALALERSGSKGRVPPAIQRARAEDLLAAVFPQQVACQDNALPGDLTPPDHPLVSSTLDDCLHEAMDVDGLKVVLTGLKSGLIRRHAVDLPEPSPLAHQLLNAMPYAFLDDAPLEERRARAVSVRRTLPEDAAAFGALDPAAIAQVVDEARPPMRDEHELHEALLQLVVAPESQLDGTLVDRLATARRAVRIDRGGRVEVVSVEKLALATMLFAQARPTPNLAPLDAPPASLEEAVDAVVRGHLEICGPVTCAELSERLALSTSAVDQSLARIEASGQLLRGRFRAEARSVEWCDRRLLQRIHRLTVGRLRQEVQPLSPQDFMRFLFRWHHLEPGEQLRGRGGVVRAAALLEGWEAPASAWESGLFAARVKGYDPESLDRACRTGEVAWGRLTPKDVVNAVGPARGALVAIEKSRGTQPTRNAPITFVRREELGFLLASARGDSGRPDDLSHPAKDVAQALEARGALFFLEIVEATGRLASEVEDALWELVARGLATADEVENLRVLQNAEEKRRRKNLRRGGPGRWSLLRAGRRASREVELERLARLFLLRYGVVFRDLVVREVLAPPWRELAAVLRRLEARGEIRGGRFVSSFAGEQFALPEAIDLARQVRRQAGDGVRVRLSAVDPLNLTGIVTPAPRVPAIAGRFLSFVDGLPQPEDEPQAKDPLVGLAMRTPRALRHPYEPPARR